MEPEAIADDYAKLEPYFAELKSWPSSYTLTAAMWHTFSQRVRDALEADLADAGYKPEQVYAVEYEDGELIRVTIPIRR